MTDLSSRQRIRRFLAGGHQWWGIVLKDPLAWVALPAEIRWYLTSLRRFKALNRESGRLDEIELQPVLFQRTPVMPFDAHYVHQGAWATRQILARRPERHVDISSHIPFVAQLSALVPVRYVEFNPPKLQLPGLTIERGDILRLPFADQSVPSLSCLHVVEHVGLGRYGDPIDPDGTRKACIELARCLAPRGSLLVSVPIGRRRVVYNAHRVLDPQDVPRYMPEGVELSEFAVVTDDRQLVEPAQPENFADQIYGCGLYRFVRRTIGFHVH